MTPEPKHTPALAIKTGTYYTRSIERYVVDIEATKYCGIRVSGLTKEEAEERAELVVRACNSHAALVEALEGMFEILKDCGRGQIERNIDYINQAKAALALAKGGE